MRPPLARAVQDIRRRRCSGQIIRTIRTSEYHIAAQSATAGILGVAAMTQGRRGKTAETGMQARAIWSLRLVASPARPMRRVVRHTHRLTTLDRPLLRQLASLLLTPRLQLTQLP